MLIPVPNPGDQMYVGDSHDFWGGLAEVAYVRLGKVNGEVTILVVIKEALQAGLEGHYDLEWLYARQHSFAQEYGKRRARPYKNYAYQLATP
jgi:hypothetical protein